MTKWKLLGAFHPIFLLTCVFGVVRCDPYNLYGDPGQAYSIEVTLGHPYQKLNLVVDTGSTTLAVATRHEELATTYFDYKNSTTIFDSGKQVTSKYSEGMWVGRVGSDYIQFPSLNLPEIRTELALITESHNFFMNGSKWQGILGLAYLPIAADGENILVDSWLSSLDRALESTTSFHLTLCGPESLNNATHYGRFQVLDDRNKTKNSPKFRTPILRKRWYEVGMIAIRVVSKSSNVTGSNTLKNDLIAENKPDREKCIQLNQQKCFIDSGTTNIRLPDTLFRQVVDQLKSAAQSANILILDEFWYHGEAACWPEPQSWPLPWLALDLLSADSDSQYFTIEIPPQSYMRVMSAGSGAALGSVAQHCYKLGLESAEETVIGYTAMEGIHVLFNRSADWIGFETSDCGPKTLIHGPYNTNGSSLIDLCQLKKSVLKTAESIKAAQWFLFVLSLVSLSILIYLLAPCIKSMVRKRLSGNVQISLSQSVLVEQDFNS